MEQLYLTPYTLQSPSIKLNETQDLVKLEMKTLELFCGTKSFSKIAKEYLCDTVTSDRDERFSPDIASDVFDLNFNRGQFDIIWASPPCEGFSVASIGHHWNKDHTPKTDVAAKSLDIVCKTIEIIKEVQPKYWFIENPRGKLRKVIDRYLQGLDYKRETISYCRYGDTRMKPTDIWTNAFEWKPIDRMCANGNPDHDSAPRGSKTGTQGLPDYEAKSIIPSELFVEIFTQL